ncbi:protein LURP-one-related 5-like [Cryptomeria japonica]|uniref:protein LURP-one-related 5-like n=1 Tax=Cryptomeria japonica TaxID=3369 RepID=UPI0027DA8D34|nr:protein LURP-one-related 5-like [Cryptomeria japonica]
MPQIHPHSSISPPHVYIDQNFCSSSSTHFTVWTKSFLFNGKGFTVFDSLGHLVFRVDNYASNVRNEVLLMDDEGQLLLTMRRKQWSLRKRWEAFRRDPIESDEPKFTLKKYLGFSNKTVANVFVDGSREIKECDYQMEGSLCKASCTIFNASGKIIAQIKRREGRLDIMLGNDVLSLVIEAGIDQAFVMGYLSCLIRYASDMLGEYLTKMVDGSRGGWPPSQF